MTELEILHTQHQTLIQYLLDELHTYKTDHSDALAPRSRNANESLIGECSLAWPVTTEEVCSMMASFEANISDLRNQMVHVKGSIDTNISDLRDQMVHIKESVQDLVSANAPLSVTINVCHTNSTNLSKETRTRLTIKLPPLATLGTSTSKHNKAVIIHLSSISISNNGVVAARAGSDCTAGGHQ